MGGDWSPRNAVERGYGLPRERSRHDCSRNVACARSGTVEPKDTLVAAGTLLNQLDADAVCAAAIASTKHPSTGWPPLPCDQHSSAISGELPRRALTGFAGQGKELTLPALTSTPLAATFVVDLPYATTGQCGQTAVAACVFNGSGSVMRCR
jgi:hypothetical protein